MPRPVIHQKNEMSSLFFFPERRMEKVKLGEGAFNILFASESIHASNLTGHLLAWLSSVTPFSAFWKNILALLIWFFIKLLHLSVTFPAKMSSSETPACASSSCGRYILPLAALHQQTNQSFKRSNEFCFTCFKHVLWILQSNLHSLLPNIS